MDELIANVIKSLDYYEFSAILIAMKNETILIDAKISNELIALCDSIIPLLGF